MIRYFLVGLFSFCLSFNALNAAEKTTENESLSVSDFTCPNGEVFGAGLMTNICWSCILPIRLFGSSIGTGDIPSDANKNPVCACPDPLTHIPMPGFSMGMWEPARLAEVVREPYCSPVLGGVKLTSETTAFRLAGSPNQAETGENEIKYYNVHYWAFPLHIMLDLLIGGCENDGYIDMDLMFMSEVDPTHNDDELALLVSPETIVVANLIAQSSCPIDCAAASLGKPIDSLFWCAGCWGGIYPLSGNINFDNSPPRNTSLLATRELAKLHRIGLARKTVGDDALCGAKIHPIIVKSQYRFSQLYPIPESSDSSFTSTGCGGSSEGCLEHGGCCHAIGASQYLWGEWRNIPAVGEDFIQMIWRYRDCCVN